MTEVHWLSQAVRKPLCQHDGTGSTSWTYDFGDVTCPVCVAIIVQIAFATS